MPKHTHRSLTELGGQELSDPRATAIMEELRQKLVGRLGVTVVGPYMTLRFGSSRGRLVHVSFQVTSIMDTTVVDPPEEDK